MQKSGHSGETELTNENGGIETGVAFFCGKSVCAFSVKHGKRMQDCEEDEKLGE